MIAIEPLDPSKHDRAAFSCGVPQVDNFFRKTANKLTKADNLRTFVLTGEDGVVIGFYAINNHAVEYTQLPQGFARDRPRHGMIPAVYISMIGRDSRFKGGGYGGVLLADCLARIAHISEQVGIAVVMLDVLDCGNAERTERRRQLYFSYGFRPLPSDPMRMFLPMATVRTVVERLAEGRS